MITANICNCIFCLLLLLIFALALSKKERSSEQRGLRRVFCFACAYMICELAGNFVDGAAFPAAIAVNYAINALSITFAALHGYSWYDYYEITLDMERTAHRRFPWPHLLPAIALILLGIASIKTGWLFYVDAWNHYQRGPWYLANLSLSYCYALIVSVKSLLLLKKTRNNGERRRCLVMASYAFFPLLTAVVQAFTPGLALNCFGVTLSIANIYANLQAQRITLDTLTRLNNRFSLENHLNYRMDKYAEGRHEGRLPYLIMLDIDRFKKVNDTFGHTEGDRAICFVADALRQACSNKQCFLSRFAGDEFVIIYEAQDDEAVESLCAEINDKVNAIDTGGAYRLSVSIGYAKKLPGESGEALLKRADAAMYRAKLQITIVRAVEE